jgi:hypothetical protein
VQLQLSVPGRRDPWWGLEGKGARRHRSRVLIESGIAFVLAVGAFCFVLALWITAVVAWLPS